MKYAILLLALSMPAFAQETTITSGEYKLKTGGVIQTQTYGNQSNAKAAATKISQACGCRVDILQPTLTVTTVKASSSKSNASSSSVSGSVSSQSSSSLPAIGMVPLTFGRPVARENGDVLTADEIKHYLLERNSGFSIIQSKEDLVTVQIDPPAENETLYLTTVDTDNVYSKRVAIEK